MALTCIEVGSKVLMSLVFVVVGSWMWDLIEVVSESYAGGIDGKWKSLERVIEQDRPSTNISKRSFGI